MAKHDAKGSEGETSKVKERHEGRQIVSDLLSALVRGDELTFSADILFTLLYAIGVADPEFFAALRNFAARGLEYSIKIPAAPGVKDCAICGLAFSATGPTGYGADVDESGHVLDEQPVCDLCMLVESPPLGMVLALISTARSFAVSSHETDGEYWDALGDLGDFGRIYERFAAQDGPPRAFFPGMDLSNDQEEEKS